MIINFKKMIQLPDIYEESIFFRPKTEYTVKPLGRKEKEYKGWLLISGLFETETSDKSFQGCFSFNPKEYVELKKHLVASR